MTNRRTDRFGGSLENRCRFALMVHEAIRRSVDDDFIVGMRLVVDEGPDGGLGFEDCVRIGLILKEAVAVDFFNAIYGSMDTTRALAEENMPGIGSPLAPWVEPVGAFRREVGLPVFHAARIADIASARFAVAGGKLDMAGMTRAQIADPHLVNKLSSGRESEVRPCVGATHCQSAYRPSCLHNPVTGRELVLSHAIERTSGPVRRVVVVGGGPAGLEAARISAVGGVLAQHAGLIHPLNYARGLADGLRSRGITLFEGTPALKLRREGQQVIVETPGGAVRSRRVLLATNGYSSMTPVTTGVRKAVVPFRSAIIATEPLGQNLRRSVMPRRRSYSETRRMMRWFRPFGDRMLFGGRGAFGKTDSPAAFETLHRAMVELFPQLDGTAISHRWSGLVGMTLDSVPQVGSLDEHVGYALGYNGAGIAMATLMGRYAADMTAGIPCDLALMNRTGLKTIPFHAVREPIVRLVAGWYQFLDAQGF